MNQEILFSSMNKRKIWQVIEQGEEEELTAESARGGSKNW